MKVGVFFWDSTEIFLEFIGNVAALSHSLVDMELLQLDPNLHFNFRRSARKS